MALSARLGLPSPRLVTLNARQRAAVRYIDGPLLVLAGAGSGKTKVITEKIASLVKRKIAAPENIAAITFTNKAANEMRQRCSAAHTDQTPWISTFHTLGLRILRDIYDSLGYRPGFSIVDNRDCENIIADLLRRTAANELAEIRLIQNRISTLKSQLVTPSTTVAEVDEDPPTRAARACLSEYNAALKTFNAVDFDDLILLPVIALQSNPDICAHWQHEIQYLLVDEYQDTNLAQYELVRSLVGEPGMLTVVGDDDQSIYAWRGARPENLVSLQSDYPSLKVIKLEQNYRSVGVILNAANRLIANNAHIFEKQLWSERGYGEKIRVNSASDEHDEVRFVADEIQHQTMIGRREFSDYAVLFRSNYQARLFEHALRERNIPYQLSGGRSFFDLSEVRDLVYYLRVISNLEDDNALLRIINSPRRGIGATSVKSFVQHATQCKSKLVAAGIDIDPESGVARRGAANIAALCRWLTQLHTSAETLDPATLFKQVINDIDYSDWIAATSDSEKHAERRWANVDELLNWISRLQANDGQRSIQDIVTSLTLFDIVERQEDENTAKQVALMTLHAAKGLEFPHVYLVGFEEAILPHQSSIDSDAVEEERRIAYVGITRAQQSLCLSFARTRQRYGETQDCLPSRFISELPEDDLSWIGQQPAASDNRATGKKTLASLRDLLQATR